MADRDAWWWPFLELAGVLESSPVVTGQVDAALGEWSGRTAEAYVRAGERERSAVLGLAAWLRRVAMAARVHQECEEEVRDAALASLVAVVRGRERDSLSTNPVASTGPAQVRRWWEAATPQERARREVELGPALGVLPGVPLVARDRMNRRTVAQDVALGLTSPSEAAGLSAPGNTLVAYTSPVAGRDATAVVARGDVESADRLAVLVPGVGTDVGDAPAQLRRTEELLAASGQDSAGLWWLGYDAPDGPGDPAMLTGVRARAAGDALARELEMVADLRRDLPEARTTVVGHSYGSTVMAHALDGTSRAGGGAGVDAAVFVGSPGAGPARRAGDLDAGEVYAVSNLSDLVAMLGDDSSLAPTRLSRGRLGLGVDPAGDDFGAVALDGGPRSERAWPDVHRSHSGYFDAGSGPLEEMGRVVAGGDS